MMIPMVNWLKKSNIAREKIDAMRLDPRIEMARALVAAKIEMNVITKGAKNVIVTVSVVLIVNVSVVLIVTVSVVAMTRSAKSETGAVTSPNVIKTAKKNGAKDNQSRSKKR